MWAVDMRNGIASTPHLLFEGNFANSAPLRNFDVSADGRFLMVENGESLDKPVTQLILVQNWFTELRQRVPVK
jgi:hypothetical protein